MIDIFQSPLHFPEDDKGTVEHEREKRPHDDSEQDKDDIEYEISIHSGKGL